MGNIVVSLPCTAYHCGSLITLQIDVGLTARMLLDEFRLTIINQWPHVSSDHLLMKALLINLPHKGSGQTTKNISKKHNESIVKIL